MRAHLPQDETTAAGPAAASRGPRRGVVIAGVLIGCWLLFAVVIHLTQGTAQDVGAAEIIRAVLGGDDAEAAAVFGQSRLPRLAAAILVGGGLGAGGAALQALSRNPLASPETVGVSAGASLALAVAAAAQITVGIWSGMTIAFVGGVITALAVIGLAGIRSLTPVRLVLAGSALAMGLSSLQTLLLLLFPWQTQGIVEWNAGSLAQNGSDATASAAPIIIIGIAALLPLSRRLDLLQLGDDTAAAFGVSVGSTRRMTLLLSIVLIAAAVVVSGPIGFVGLCAPASVRLLARWFPGVRRTSVLILFSALAGIALVLCSDVLLRAVIGTQKGVSIPTGAVTSIIGAVFLILAAQRLRDSGHGESLANLRAGTRLGRTHPVLSLTGAGMVLTVTMVAAMLLGDTDLLLGDLWQWVRGIGPAGIELILDLRLPRVLGALLAGASLALAGLLVQAVTRNPLADPGILGVSSSAGLGAVVALTAVSGAGAAVVFGSAAIGAALATVLLLLLARTNQLRMVLVGIGISAGTGALTTLILVRTDPYSQTKAMTWLSGSTYGTTLAQISPMVVLLLICGVVLSRTHHSLDLLQLDDTTPAVRGVAMSRMRLVHVVLAVALTTAATTAVGVIAFGGLVAPHIARLIIGKRHIHLAPLTAITGGVLLVLADVAGRALIAPTQIPAGLTVALLGTPFFLWLLHRLRLDTR